MGKWKTAGRRALALLLTLLLCLGLLPMAVFAANVDGETGPQTPASDIAAPGGNDDSGDKGTCGVCLKPLAECTCQQLCETCGKPVHEGECQKDEPQLCEDCKKPLAECECGQQDAESAEMKAFQAAFAAVNEAEDKEAALADVEKAYEALTAEEKIAVAAQWDYFLTQAAQIRAGNPDNGIATVPEDGGETQTEVERLQAAVQAGGEYTLNENVTLTTKIEITKDFTLHLNGNVITADTKGARAFWVTAPNVNLVIDGMVSGSGIKGDAYGAAEAEKVWGLVDMRSGSAGSSLTVNGGNYSGSTCANDNNHYGSLFMVRDQNTTVTLTGINAETDVNIVNYYGGASGTLTVQGGEFNITGIDAYLTGAFYTGNSVATFTGMSLTAKYGGCVQGGRDTTLNNCTITVTDTRTGQGTHQNCAMSVQGGGELTVNGGTYSAPYGAYVYNSGGTINIDGGTFTGTKAVLKADKSVSANQSVINVTKGEFNGSLGIASGATLAVSGGTFKDESGNPLAGVSAYVASSSVYNEETGTVTPLTAENSVARIGEGENAKYYGTLQAAINAAQNGDTVTLLADTTVTGSGIQINKKTITLDLNGKTITGETISNVYGAVNVNNASNVTLVGNGGGITADGVAVYLYASSAATVFPKLTVNGGTYKGNASGCLYAEKGDITVYDGHFSCDEYKGKSFVLNKLDTNKDKCTFVVYGGTFVGCNPAENNNENPAENQVAPSYKSEETAEGSNTWRVVPDLGTAVASVNGTYYTSLADAIKAAKAGEEIVLLKDVDTGNSYSMLNKAIGLNLNGHTITSSTEFTVACTRNVTIKNGTITNSNSGNGKAIYVQKANITLDNVNAAGPNNSNLGSAGIMLGNGVAVGYWGSATIKNSTITGGYTGISVVGPARDNVSTADIVSTLIVENSEISGTGYGVSGNGLYDATSITLNDGAKVSGPVGIYHPQQGILILNSGAKVSGLVGVQICAGQATINDGAEISSTATSSFGDPVKPVEQSDGSIQDGSALSVNSRQAYGDVSVSVNGGNFQTNAGNAAVVKYGAEKDGEWVFTFDETEFKTNASLTITGGTFSTNVQTNCAAPYYAEQTGSVWTVVDHSVAANHKWNAGEVTTEPTATTEGVRTFTCTVCGATRTEAIPATGGGTTTPVTPPTTPTTPTYPDYTYPDYNYPTNPVTPVTPGGGETDIGDDDPPLADLPISAIYTDVEDGKWYSDAVKYVTANKLMEGDGNRFALTTKTSRGMVVTILYRMDKEPAVSGVSRFTDFESGRYYSNAAIWGENTRVVDGLGDGSIFGAGDDVSREQIAVFLYNYASYKGWDVSARGDLSVFSDSGSIHGWAKEAMAWAVGAGLMEGDNGALRPRESAYRVELAELLKNFGEKYMPIV